jgi:hypothetical protein
MSIQFQRIHRWFTILSLALGFGRGLGALYCGKHALCGGFKLVLVHYTSRVPDATLFIQHGSLFVSYCGDCRALCEHDGGVSSRLWLERGTSHGTFLFPVDILYI